MTRIAVLILPVVFTAQACNLLLGSGDDGSGARGIFYSVDSGDSWTAAKPSSETLSLSGAAVSRLFIEGDKPRNIIAASSNAGLLASDSFGREWAVLLPGFSAYDAFVNPFNDREIFAAGRGKHASIYKSADRGQSWVQVWSQPRDKIAAAVLAFDRRDPKILYAGLSSGTLLKSTDGGDTWNALGALKNGVVRLAVAGNQVYALTQTGGLHSSSDSGASWKKIEIKAQTGGKFNDLYADSAGVNLLVAANQGLYVSPDSGASWRKLPVPATAQIADVSAVTVSPAKKSQIFAAVRSTVYRSDDNGQTFRTVQLPSDRVITSIVIDPFEPNRIYAGLR